MRVFWRVLAIVAAGVAHVLLQAGPLFARPDFAWNSFRAYFPGDQLSYMSMVVNASQGQFESFEPFTETGVNNYPHAYYLLLGFGAHVLGIQPIQAWTFGGTVVQFLFICFLATTLVLLSKRAWVALLAPLPFLLGTFAFAFGPGWFTGLDSHAVLWGAFATIFTLNGEVFSLCIGGSALLLILLAWVYAKRPWARYTLAAVGALLIGSLANIQTYSFFVVVFVAVYVLAAYGVSVTRRRWVWAAVSLVIAGLLFAVGPVVSARLGPLATLALGLAPAVPGLIVLLIRTKGVIAGFAVLALIGAAPQLIGTALGILGHDPFLTYRVASSKNLGVGPIGIIASLALTLPLLGILAAGIVRRSNLLVAYSVGVLFSWTLMSANDVWGANQEPYRFWLDTFVVVCMTILPMGVLAVRAMLAPGVDSAIAGSPEQAERPVGRRVRTWTFAAIALVTVVGAVSAIDMVRFSGDPAYHGLWNYNDPRYQAIAALAQKNLPPDGEMFVTDPCIDALGFKIVSGAPEASFNAGMAWPADYQGVKDVMDARAQGVFQPDAALAAGVTRVVADSACTTADWAAQYRDSLELLGSKPYDVNGQTGTISVWRVR